MAHERIHFLSRPPDEAQFGEEFARDKIGTTQISLQAPNNARHSAASEREPEYWIVNPQNETITVLQLVGYAYKEAGRYHRGESARSVLRPKFVVAVDAVFDAAKSK